MKTSERFFVDIHVLQTVPPSCVNRDDTGSPKTAIYGGAVRARVSSQSWKRAMREMFRDYLTQENRAYRTKKIVKMVEEEIKSISDSVDAESMAGSILKTAGLKIKSADKGTDALFFMSVAQAKALAEYAVNHPEAISEKPSKEVTKNVKSLLKDNPGIEVSLFGRMVADDPSLNTDACSQVAHSISTHKVSNEYDYFTAVDDLSSEDNAGAGHIGTVEFNSSTLYRYGTIAVHELHNYLGEETSQAVNAFIKAFVLSMPKGKINSFANNSLPDDVLVTIRKDQPINLAGAFEKPVQAGKSASEGYLKGSVEAFVKYTSNTYNNWVSKPEMSFVIGEDFDLLGEKKSLSDLIDSVDREIIAWEANNGERQ